MSWHIIARRVGRYHNESRKLLLASFILVPLIYLLMWGHHLLLRRLDLQGFVWPIHRKHISGIYFKAASKERPSLLFFLYENIKNDVMDFETIYLFTVQVKKTKTREDCMRCWKAYIKLFPFHPRCWNPFIHNSEINHNWPMIFLSVSVHLSKHLLVLRMIQLRGFYLVGFTLSTSASRLSGICCLHRSLLNDDAPLSWGLITCC